MLPPMERDAFRAGLRAMGSPGIAIAAWGVVTGVAMVEGGLSVAKALVMTFVVFAGSAQLAVLFAAAVFAKTRSMLIMMAAGMTVFTLLRLYT